MEILIWLYMKVVSSFLSLNYVWSCAKPISLRDTQHCGKTKFYNIIFPGAFIGA